MLCTQAFILPYLDGKPLTKSEFQSRILFYQHPTDHVNHEFVVKCWPLQWCYTGTVVDIIYQNNHQPPDLPIVVTVEFENYRGPVFNENQLLCIPIYPITVTSQTGIGFHERQQLPLRLAWALTIHKSQGLTLPKAWIDIGKSERTAGVSYVAISRVKSLASCVIEPMMYED